MARLSSGMAASSATSSMYSAKLSVASITFCENWLDSSARRLDSAAKRCLSASGSSAPDRRKSRRSFSMIFLRAALAPANAGLAATALKRANRSRFCPSSVKKAEIRGISALYASRRPSVLPITPLR
ncbi:hypothetical protein D3C85_1514340 [compost metagenome]